MFEVLPIYISPELNCTLVHSFRCYRLSYVHNESRFELLSRGNLDEFARSVRNKKS